MSFKSLLSACESVTVSVDQPLLEFDCGNGTERLLVHPEARSESASFRTILEHLEVEEERIELSRAARWLDELPGNPLQLVEEQQVARHSNCPPFPIGTRLRVRMGTVFADWKRNLSFSSVDFVGKLMVIRDRDCVVYCHQAPIFSDQLFSLSAKY